MFSRKDVIENLHTNMDIAARVAKPGSQPQADQSGCTVVTDKSWSDRYMKSIVSDKACVEYADWI